MIIYFGVTGELSALNSTCLDSYFLLLGHSGIAVEKYHLYVEEIFLFLG